MLDVIGLRLNEADIKVLKPEVPESVNVNLKVDKISIKKGTATLDFTYTIDYAPKVARCIVRGSAFCRDNPANMKKLTASWKKKVLPPELGANVVNVINANVGMNSVFLTRPFNLAPPFMPPVVAPPETLPRRKKK